LNTLKNKLPIAFFDSGVGGLTVFKKFKEILPLENTVYYGDTKNLPYGTKTKEELIKYTRNVFNFFQGIGVKAVVMACNTTSAVTYDVVKDEFPFEIYPIIQSVGKILAEEHLDRLGVFATQVTVNSQAYKRIIETYSPKTEVKQIGCSGWVELVENRSEQDKTALLKKYLCPMLEFNPEKIVLGCTHYPYLQDELKKLLPKESEGIEFIDPSKNFVEFIKTDLEKKGLLNKENKEVTEEFYVSSDEQGFKTSAKMFYEIKEDCNLFVI